VRRGAHSVGAHVRDAAAFVAWASSRAFSRAELLEGGDGGDASSSVAQMLAPHLLACACLDREVNCRRAAAAAFQELVGRTGGAGGVRRGIDAVQSADYFTLGTRSGAFLSCAPAIALLDGEYALALAQLLLTQRSGHWDAGVRRLAAEALPLLSPALPRDWLTASALPALLRAASSATAEPAARHGALLSLAALLTWLGGDQLDAPAVDALSALVPAIEASRAFRGRGGELLREAACSLLAAVFHTRLPVPPAALDSSLAVAEECLRCSSDAVQAGAAHARAALAGACFADAPAPLPTDWAGGTQAVALRYCTALREAQAAPQRRGAARALALMHPSLLRSSPERAARACLAAARPPAGAAAGAAAIGAPTRDGEVDAETRVHAVAALAHILSSCGVGRAHGALPTEFLVECCVPALLGALGDYSTDNRGDVGSWVREASMRALPPTLQLLYAADAAALHASGLALAAAQLLLKQAAEKIDRTRAAAAASLSRLLLSLPPDSLPHSAELRLAFLPAGEASLAAAAFQSPSEAFGRLCPLLRLPPYLPPLMQGLLISAGALGESLAAAASAALLAQLDSPDSQQAAFSCLLDALQAAQARRDAAAGRVTLPALRTAELMLGGCASLAAGARGAQPLRLRALRCCEAEYSASEDVAALCATACALAQLAAVLEEGDSEPCDVNLRRAALTAICRLLACPFPRVRRAAAEAAYLRLMGCSGCEGEDGEAAESLLAATRWDGGDGEVHAALVALHSALALGPPPEMAASRGARDASRAGVGGEDESYASLVESAGY